MLIPSSLKRPWLVPHQMKPDEIPADCRQGAGYIHGAPRLGVPALNETDASLGIANLRGVEKGDGSTGLPGGLSLASTWDPEIAPTGVPLRLKRPPSGKDTRSSRERCEKARPRRVSRPNVIGSRPLACHATIGSPGLL